MRKCSCCVRQLHLLLSCSVEQFQCSESNNLQSVERFSASIRRGLWQPVARAVRVVDLELVAEVFGVEPCNTSDNFGRYPRARCLDDAVDPVEHLSAERGRNHDSVSSHQQSVCY